MFGKGGMGNIMQQAQKMQERMQENMKKLEEELSHMNVTGESGAGMVKVVMNGNKNMCSMNWSKLINDPEEKEMLEDLIVAATNDAYCRAEELHQEKMGEITGGMGLPPGFKMPF